MTNQEAQNALANLKRYMSGGGAVDRVVNKAIDIAIEALDAQSEGEKDEWIEAWVSGYPAIHHRRCNTFIYAPNGKRGYNFCPRCGYPMKGDVE